MLYVPAAESPRDVLARIERACTGPLGPDVAVLVRAYAFPTRDLLAVLTSAHAATRAAGARLLVSGRVDLACVADIGGVHLAAHGMPVDDALRLVTGYAGMIVGASCHDEAELERARRATYVTLSPVGFVPDKRPPLGLAGFRALASRSVPPVLALGGIALDDVPALVEAGAWGVAVRRSIDEAPDPVRAIQQLLRGIRVDLAP